MPEPTDPKAIIEEDIAGVQGEENRPARDKTSTGADGPSDVEAPDAGEIEWAGGLVKKAPRSAG